MPNKALNLTSGLIRDWVPVTPSDSTANMTANADDVVVGFYVTVGGAVAFVVGSSTRTVTFPSNFYVTCAGATRINSTGTTATGIFSLVI